jgi:hypothetical protein
MRKTKFFFPPVCFPRPDGSVLVKPAKPIQSAELTTAQFARASGMSQRTVQALYAAGDVRCRRLNPRPKSRLIVPTTELQKFLQPQ